MYSNSSGTKKHYSTFGSGLDTQVCISFVSSLGEFVMATSKPGNVVMARSMHRQVDRWTLDSLRSSIAIHYRMKNTLEVCTLIL